MQKRLLHFFLLFTGFFSANGQNNQYKNTTELLGEWKKQYSQEALQTMTFAQTTIRFKDNKPIDTSTWYEAIMYPDQFRIDFGNQKDGNLNLWRSDSVYAFRKSQLVKSDPEIQQFLLIEGGLYRLPLDTIIHKLRRCGVNTDEFRTENIKGRLTFIIGAKKEDKTSPQIWLDAQYRAPVFRIMQIDKDKTIEIYYDQFAQIDGHWTETYLEFYMDGNLIQTEHYHDILMNPKLKKGIFNKSHCLQNYWY